ncbi:LPS-assembly protein LptD [Sulfurimonas sp. MAG313]|nr:hypothetical protein [Sulfurimonas sp. MAG313]MDF1881824.1 LPS-assembly protein LptD [Sulfurimonas sp. MAG313]
MPKTLFILFFLCSSFLYADKKVEVFSKNIDTNGSIIHARNNVVVLYDDMYISANSATFDKDAGIIELFGKVSVLKNAEYYSMGEYFMLNTKEKTKEFRPFFFQEHDDDLWLSSREAKAKEKKYELYSGVVSSCNAQDPDWTIQFSSGYYDSENQWMQLYNARLYAGDIPVMYLPYFAYPTDTTRRTGLLIPRYGISEDEGLIYEQPIYIAESANWDVEILPQLRTKRGYGLYSKIRFVDSKKSKGSITFGGFQEKEAYQKKFNLKNDKHYGIEFDYEHRGFLKTWLDWDVQGKSGIFSDITLLNDVEYLNVKKNDTLAYATTSQVTSKVNVFLNQNEDYYGSYAKYFIDLSVNNNSETIQNLPTLQYHHYINTLLEEHFFYSFDYRGDNFYRPEGKSAFQNELRIPLSLQFPLFDEFLTLSVRENLYTSQINFYGKDKDLSNFEYSS